MNFWKYFFDLISLLQSLNLLYLFWQYTLRTAQKTYGCEMIDVALAHRAVSKALLAVQDFEDMAYFHHASEALRIAQAQLPDQYHGMMAMFLHSSGKWNSPQVR